MIRKVIRIENELGLHARAAAQLIKITSQFESSVQLSSLDQKTRVDGRSILSVMLLAAGKGTELEVAIEGPDEEQAMAAIVSLVEARFNEPK